MTAQQRPLGGGGRIEDARGLVLTATGEHAAARRERHRQYAVDELEGTHLPVRRYVPQTRCLVLTARRQDAAVRRERQRAYGVLVAFERLPRFLGFHRVAHVP